MNEATELVSAVLKDAKGSNSEALLLILARMVIAIEEGFSAVESSIDAKM